MTLVRGRPSYVQRIMKGGRLTMLTPRWKDAWLHKTRPWVVSRVLVGTHPFLRWVSELADAAGRDLQMGGIVHEHDLLWIARERPTEQRPRQSLIVGFAVEERQPRRFHRLAADGRRGESYEYPTPKASETVGHLGYPPAIGVIWLAEVHRGRGWGPFLAEGIQAHYGVRRVAWKPPFTAAGWHLAQKVSADGRVLTW